MPKIEKNILKNKQYFQGGQVRSLLYGSYQNSGLDSALEKIEFEKIVD